MTDEEEARMAELERLTEALRQRMMLSGRMFQKVHERLGVIDGSIARLEREANSAGGDGYLSFDDWYEELELLVVDLDTELRADILAHARKRIRG